MIFLIIIIIIIFTNKLSYDFIIIVNVLVDFIIIVNCYAHSGAIFYPLQ